MNNLQDNNHDNNETYESQRITLQPLTFSKVQSCDENGIEIFEK